jgi:hypothetical protein
MGPENGVASEILSMILTDININRWLRLGDLEELELFAKIGIIDN